MNHSVRHLHHVTATVATAQPDLDFYQGLLGLRLVKQTVNFDNPNVYHFYYGTERGAPGTIMTTFPYEREGVRKGIPGTGQVAATAFAIPLGSLSAWEQRFHAQGLVPIAIERYGEQGWQVQDPSGLIIELIESEDERTPWLGSALPAELAITGLHSVTLSLASTEATARLLSETLGFVPAGAEGQRQRFRAGEAAAGHYVDLLHEPGKPKGKNGIGTVHHVALAIADEAAQRELREQLVQLDYQVTEVKDRKYFRSIYFREQGGVLFEVATLAPGFAVDESPGQLGETLMLPEWAEMRRPVIQENLEPIQLASHV